MSDIDIIVDESDYESLLALLEKKEYDYQSPNEQYQTKHFFSLESEGIDVDIMIDFNVIKDQNLYHFPFHIEKEIILQNTTIYLSSVQEWLNAYIAMNRIDKVLTIQASKKRN